jgi:hypothetical protein
VPPAEGQGDGLMALRATGTAMMWRDWHATIVCYKEAALCCTRGSDVCKARWCGSPTVCLPGMSPCSSCLGFFFCQGGVQQQLGRPGIGAVHAQNGCDEGAHLRGIHDGTVLLHWAPCLVGCHVSEVLLLIRSCATAARRAGPVPPGGRPPAAW